MKMDVWTAVNDLALSVFMEGLGPQPRLGGHNLRPGKSLGKYKNGPGGCLVGLGLQKSKRGGQSGRGVPKKKKGDPRWEGCAAFGFPKSTKDQSAANVFKTGAQQGLARRRGGEGKLGKAQCHDCSKKRGGGGRRRCSGPARE